jgi:DnaK suppressor protein
MNNTLATADIQQCEARLLQRRAELRGELLERLGPAAGATPRAIEVHDLKDEAFAHLLANLANTELAHVRDELAAIQTALQRIASGTYGSCVECARDIGRERLVVQPSAERCLPCQERLEKSSAPPRRETIG